MDKVPENIDAFSSKDHKTELQEYVQKHFKTLAVYELVNELGPDHQKEFEMAVMVEGKEYGRGKGMSKKQAEQAAAAKALGHLSGIKE